MPEEATYRTRAWPIRVIALLLLLEAVVMVGLNFFYLSGELANKSTGEVNTIIEQLGFQENTEPLPVETTRAIEALISAIFLAPLAIPAVLAGIAFLFMFRFGWLLAMITQVAGLSLCLMLYFEFKPPLIYPIMVYCILMILYLNVHEVRLAFLSRAPVSEQR